MRPWLSVLALVLLVIAGLAVYRTRTVSMGPTTPFTVVASTSSVGSPPRLEKHYVLDIANHATSPVRIDLLEVRPVRGNGQVRLWTTPAHGRGGPHLLATSPVSQITSPFQLDRGENLRVAGRWRYIVDAGLGKEQARHILPHTATIKIDYSMGGTHRMILLKASV